MLIHEWMRHRDRHQRQPLGQEEPTEVAEVAPVVEVTEERAAEDRDVTPEPTEEVEIIDMEEAVPDLPPEVAREAWEQAELADREFAKAKAAAEARRVEGEAEPGPYLESDSELREFNETPNAVVAARTARRSLAEVLPDLPEAQSRRLQALLGRQAQLPLDVEFASPPPRRGQLEPAESREELIERLLDPILSINEAAVLCGVCPASVRRYTNRGALRCFRTPGNQRRFRLSDVLDFMERQQQEPLD